MSFCFRSQSWAHGAALRVQTQEISGNYGEIRWNSAAESDTENKHPTASPPLAMRAYKMYKEEPVLALAKHIDRL